MHAFLVMALAQSEAPPAACAAAMNAFCNGDPAMAGCLAEIAAANGTLPLVALRDTDAGGGARSWRCYSPSCLDASRAWYVAGKGCKLYCSHDAELSAILSAGCASTLLFENGANATACFRIPNVIAIGAANATTTTLLAFAEARRKSCSDKGPKSLAMRRSLDGGGSWEPTRFLVSDAAAASDGLNLGASVVDARSGTVFVHYGVCGHSCRPHGSTFILSSADRGATWAKADITAMVAAAGWGMINAGPGTGVQLPWDGGGGGGPPQYPGRMAVAVWGRRLETPAEAEGGVAALLSDDGGATWRLSAVPVLATPAHAPNECQLAALANGSLLMNVRDARANGCKCRLFTRSDDGGETWTALREQPALTGPVCQGSMISVNDTGGASGGGGSSSSSMPLFYSAPQSLEAREDGYIKASVDGGASWWLRGDRLDSAAEPGFGYSGLVDLGAAATAASGASGASAAGGAAAAAPPPPPHVRQLGVIYEPGGGGIEFKTVSVDYSDIL
jgi:sialidase-1